MPGKVLLSAGLGACILGLFANCAACTIGGAIAAIIGAVIYFAPALDNKN